IAAVPRTPRNGRSDKRSIATPSTPAAIIVTAKANARVPASANPVRTWLWPEIPRNSRAYMPTKELIMNTLKCSDVDQLKNAVNQGEAEVQHHRGQRSFAATAVSPFREGGEALQQLNTARILQVFQPEVERIGPGSRRELVDVGFVCVGVLHTPGCADPRRPEWGLGKAVANRPDVRKRIMNRG